MVLAFLPYEKKLGGDVKRESVDDDCLCTDDDYVQYDDDDHLQYDAVKTEHVNYHVQYYRDNCNLPKFSESSPNIEEIFNICLLHNVPQEKVKTKPTRIKETATFVVYQDLINLKYPYDVEADDTPGSFIKRDQVRFYQATISDDRELCLSTEVHVKKNNKGSIIGGMYNRRENGKWKSTAANLSSCML